MSQEVLLAFNKALVEDKETHGDFFQRATEEELPPAEVVEYAKSHGFDITEEEVLAGRAKRDAQEAEQAGVFLAFRQALDEDYDEHEDFIGKLVAAGVNGLTEDPRFVIDYAAGMGFEITEQDVIDHLVLVDTGDMELMDFEMESISGGAKQPADNRRRRSLRRRENQISSGYCLA